MIYNVPGKKKRKEKTGLHTGTQLYTLSNLFKTTARQYFCIIFPKDHYLLQEKTFFLCFLAFVKYWIGPGK